MGRAVAAAWYMLLEPKRKAGYLAAAVWNENLGTLE